jgi:hypothetical protein
MKLLGASITIVLAVGIGLALGFAVRRHGPGDSGLEEQSQSPLLLTTGKTSGSLKAQTRSRVDDSPLATKLEHDLSMSSGVVRWLYWLEALEKAEASDFPRLVLMAKGNPAITKLVADRWAELYPRDFFDRIVTASRTGDAYAWGDLAIVLFREWPKRDPEAAIGALNQVKDFGGRDSWRDLVAESIFENDVERGLRLMSEWHIENFGPRLTAVGKWAAADPLHAAEFTFANPAGFASREVMGEIGKEWAKSNPAAALEFAGSHRGELSSTLGGSVLAEWASRDLAQAADWLAKTEEPTRNRLSPQFVEAWGRKDASGALAWAESNLSGSSLAQGASAVLRGAAEKDIAGAAQIVAEMDSSAARSEAALAVAQKWFPQPMTETPVPPEALAWLKTLDPDSVRHVMDNLAWEWAETDPKSMAEFFSTASSDQAPSWTYGMLARTLARKDPAGALQWASRLPADQRFAAGGEAFGEWRKAQPEPAMSWLNDLPASDPRRRPFLETAIRNIAYDSQTPEQLASMSDAEQAIAREVIEEMKLPHDRRDRLLGVLKAR